MPENVLNNVRYRIYVGLTPSVPTKTYLRRVNSNPTSGGRKAIGVRGLRIRGESATVVILAILLR